MHIAIVEDEVKIAALLEDYLHKDEFSVSRYENGAVALEALIDNEPDLILLDLMLPGLDGMSFCREFRKKSNTPIIMLTARAEEIDRLLGLEVGADDYICKPFSPREVVARVKAVLRRTGSAESVSSSVANHTFRLDESTAMVTIEGNSTSLTSVELKLLKVMSDKPGQIFNRNQLMNRIYTDGRIVSDRTIDSHVKKLRHKLQELCATRQFVHSVYGIGYKFEIQESP